MQLSNGLMGSNNIFPRYFENVLALRNCLRNDHFKHNFLQQVNLLNSVQLL